MYLSILNPIILTAALNFPHKEHMASSSLGQRLRTRFSPNPEAVVEEEPPGCTPTPNPSSFFPAHLRSLHESPLPTHIPCPFSPWSLWIAWEDPRLVTEVPPLLTCSLYGIAQGLPIKIDALGARVQAGVTEGATQSFNELGSPGHLFHLLVVPRPYSR